MPLVVISNKSYELVLILFICIKKGNSSLHFNLKISISRKGKNMMAYRTVNLTDDLNLSLQRPNQQGSET